MSKILITLLLSLGITSSVVAENPVKEGAFTAPNSSILDVKGRSDFDLGVNIDYGVGFVMGYKDTVDLSLGYAGTGIDFKFFNYKFMNKSKFFSKKPLNFYVGAGLGYIWKDKYSNLRKGFLIRTPIGANWQFDKEWSCYISASPVVNFQKSHGNHKSDTDFSVMGTTGIRYLF